MFRALSSAFILTLLLACEVDTRVNIDGKNPPSFRFSGSGGITLFRIVEDPAPGLQFLDATVLWELKPTSELSVVRMADLPTITYGTVPPGFVQTKPEAGSPPALEDEKTYDAWAPSHNANGGGQWFRVRGNTTLPVDK